MTGPVEAIRARYVVDRDGDLWQSSGNGAWSCLTTESCAVLGGDLMNVCGPLVELVPRTEAKRIETLLAIVNAVGKLHTHGTLESSHGRPAREVCDVCTNDEGTWETYPCPTVAALAGLTVDGEGNG